MNKIFGTLRISSNRLATITAEFSVISLNSHRIKSSINYSSSSSSTVKMVTGKKYILQKQFSGFPKESDVKIVEEELRPIQEGEYLCQSLYISVDPYQRAYYQKVGDVVLGSQVARILESKNPKFLVGQHVITNYGWKTHHILDDTPSKLGFATRLIPKELTAPLHYYLGVLGLTGVSAYFGLLEICQPKSGETVVVTGAAGAVGSTVGQIAKLKGCTVIGVVGSKEKGEWITQDLGFDGYVNYKDEDCFKTLKKLTPQGIDCYFDNVGGEISSQILKQMNNFGRISICGAISTYNNLEDYKASFVQGVMVLKQLKMEGFHVTRWNDRWEEAVKMNAQWLREGKLKSQETITKGFENTFVAFTNMLKGVNFGKAIVEL